MYNLLYGIQFAYIFVIELDHATRSLQTYHPDR